MNLEELRSVQRAERQKDSLQHLRDSFYEDVADYILQLKDERERAVAAADDPFASEDVRKLTDKIESTQEIANALYERRVGKVVKHASFAAADMATDEDGMTTEERELFEDLVGRIRENRETVMAVLDGKSESSEQSAPSDASSTESQPETPPAEAEKEPAPMETTRDSDPADDLLADALGDATAPRPGSTDAPPAPPDTADTPEPSQAASTPDSTGSDRATAGQDRPAEAVAVASGDSSEAGTTSPSQSSPADGPDLDEDTRTDDGPDRTTLRITADVGTVYGVDEREYDLAREDVVMLPTTNAEPLLQKNAAERID